jgi:hypothetical protein
MLCLADILVIGKTELHIIQIVQTHCNFAMVGAAHHRRLHRVAGAAHHRRLHRVAGAAPDASVANH